MVFLKSFPLKKINSQNKSGFTLLEILLVVAAIAILAGIVIVAINPARQLGQTRNAQRKADVNTILSAIYQYMIDNNGVLPGTITNSSCDKTVTKEICKGTCSPSSGTDLFVLTNLQTYLVAIPNDPQGASTNGSGYYVTKNDNGRVTVCAPNAELNETIAVTR
jgi:type IV pilus assembly protein PilA